jgi:glycosyltransferase involved in cell wall biosynthesis
MSTFNSAATLGPVIESLLSQTYKNIEILVIDDCSGDTTVEIATMFAQRDSRVRVFRQPQNGGTYRARNRALREAKGVFFTCNDSDDWAHPVKIEELVTPLMENEGSIATIGNLLRINEDIGIRPRQRGYVQEDQSSLCYRKDWVVQNLGFYETVPFGADSEFLSRLRAVAGDSVVRISKPLLFADWSKSSLTGSLRTGITDGGTMAAARYKYRTMYRERHAAGQFFIDLAEL